MKNILTCLGSAKSQRHIALIGVVIGICWVGVYIIVRLLGTDQVLGYALGSEGGSIVLQLFTYSFIHFIFHHLVLDMLRLWALVNISRHCLNRDSFIRIYSLGTVGSGLISLLIHSLFGAESRAIGGYLAFFTMLSALAILRPNLRLYLLGESAAKFLQKYFWRVLFVAGFFYWVTLTYRHFSLSLVLGYLGTFGVIFTFARYQMNLIRLFFLYTVCNLGFDLIWRLVVILKYDAGWGLYSLPGYLTTITGCIAGALYAIIEKLCAKYGKNMKVS